MCSFILLFFLHVHLFFSWLLPLLLLLLLSSCLHGIREKILTNHWNTCLPIRYAYISGRTKLFPFNDSLEVIINYARVLFLMYTPLLFSTHTLMDVHVEIGCIDTCVWRWIVYAFTLPSHFEQRRITSWSGIRSDASCIHRRFLFRLDKQNTHTHTHTRWSRALNFPLMWSSREETNYSDQCSWTSSSFDSKKLWEWVTTWLAEFHQWSRTICRRLTSFKDWIWLDEVDKHQCRERKSIDRVNICFVIVLHVDRIIRAKSWKWSITSVGTLNFGKEKWSVSNLSTLDSSKWLAFPFGLCSHPLCLSFIKRCD